MARQNLTERAAVIAVNELSGKVGVREARDYLRGKGLLPPRDDLADEGELDFTRRIFQKSENYSNTEGTGKFAWANLVETDKEGNQVHYYKKLPETTIDEAVQDLGYWHNWAQIGMNRLRDRFEAYAAIHGKRTIQRRLTFDIPPAADEQETGAA